LDSAAFFSVVFALEQAIPPYYYSPIYQKPYSRLAASDRSARAGVFPFLGGA
jgi:hypothetical protein